MKTKFTLFFAVVFVLTTAAQKWTNYSTVNGLQNNYVYASAVDAQGNKWFGTNGGVSKFDGTNWISYTKENSGFPGNVANAIAIDTLGNIWFGTDYGVSKFDGTNWTNFMASDYVSVSCLAFDKQGHLWIGATSGSKGDILVYDGINWKSYFTDILGSQITSIAIESTGDIWVGTRFKGVSKFDGTNVITYTTANSGLSHDDVSSVAIDEQGNKWFATGAGVTKFDNTNWTTYSMYGLRAITIESAGNIWVASTGWIAKFDSHQWTTYPNPGVIALQFMSIAIDPTGNKWLGTYGNGIFKFEDVTTGIADSKSESLAREIVSAYPNPTAHETLLQFPHSDKYSLLMTDSKGTLVKQFSEINGEKIQISTNDMKPGNYLLILKSRTNGNTYNGKIVVAR